MHACAIDDHPFASSGPNWVNVWAADPTSLLSNTLPKPFASRVFKHTTGRMRLWSFVRHLTGFRHAVKLLYQQCNRDQVRVRIASKESTVHGHLWQRRLQMLAGIFCLALAAISFSLAFLLDFNLTSVSFDLTLAHSAWENCTTACRQGSHTLTFLVPQLFEVTFVSQQSLDPSC